MTYEQLSITLQSTLARLAAVEEAVKQTPIVRAVTALRPEPGDIVVITMPLAEFMKREQKAAIAKGFQDAMPGARIAVMPDTMAVNILGPRKAPPPSLDMGVQQVGFEAISEQPIRPSV